MTASAAAAMLPLGVCVFDETGANRARTSSYGPYLLEILGHAGLFHTAVAADQLETKLAALRVLVTVGEVELPESTQRKLAEWVNAGGAWLSIAGLCGMESLLGVTRTLTSYKNWGGSVRSLGEGYLVAERTDHPILAHINRPLHYFGGAAVEASAASVLATGQDAHGRPTQQAVVLEHIVGKGRCILLAVDITGTVVHIQQGRGGVTRDGVPAPDGTSPVNDGVLKSDDGAVLDWLFDREPVPGAEGLSIFAQPIADLWRDVVIRSILHLAQATQTSLPVLWYWPRGIPAVGHLSHDTDGNDPKLAERLLQTLAAGEVQSTWCVILPGYAPELMSRIHAAGHEFAMHYDSMTTGLPWSPEQFDRQHGELTALFGGEKPTTNKNHYLRWQGDSDIWDWCLEHGIELDQSKGASKTGEAGYNFGTCHTYFPIRPDNSLIDVLELATVTQDLHVFAPEAICPMLLEQSIKHHGVFHLLFHPAHFHRDDVPEAMSTAIRRGKERGLEWWTARQINAWERARRKVRVTKYETSGSQTQLVLDSPDPLSDATLLWLGPGEVSLGMTGHASQPFQAWGFTFQAVAATLHESVAATAQPRT